MQGIGSTIHCNEFGSQLGEWIVFTGIKAVVYWILTLWCGKTEQKFEIWASSSKYCLTMQTLFIAGLSFWKALSRMRNTVGFSSRTSHVINSQNKIHPPVHYGTRVGELILERRLLRMLFPIYKRDHVPPDKVKHCSMISSLFYVYIWAYKRKIWDIKSFYRINKAV